MNSLNDNLDMLLIPVSWGELYDKISILNLKMAKVSDIIAKKNIENELNFLNGIVQANSIGSPHIKYLCDELILTNEHIWAIENDIRKKEALGNFDNGFIDSARSARRWNDKRAAIKYEINDILNSTIVEEKIY